VREHSPPFISAFAERVSEAAEKVSGPEGRSRRTDTKNLRVGFVPSFFHMPDKGTVHAKLRSHANLPEVI
jgi:hypothetical protein